MGALGRTFFVRQEAFRILVQLAQDFPATQYRLIGCNCQTFAIVLCEQLGLGRCIPKQYSYFAKPLPIRDVGLAHFLPAGLDSLKSLSFATSGQCSTVVQDSFPVEEVKLANLSKDVNEEA